MSRKWMSITHMIFVLAFLLTACGGGAETTTQPPAETPVDTAEVTEVMTEAPAATEAATEAMTEAPTATEAMTEASAVTETAAVTESTAGTQAPGDATALVAVRVDEDPTLDGAADDAAWENAQPATIPVAGGANNGATQVSIRSVYTGDRVYFLVTWADPSETWLRVPWEKQQDGSWMKLNDPNDRGGDNNQFYEDKISFIWPIDNSVPGFESTGCFVACHAGENPEEKPYGNKYLAEEGQLADIWHWKSVRNLNQVDDQYLDHTRYSEDTPEAGRHSDPNDGGGYVNNETEDQTNPAFMPSDGGNKDGSPGYILDEEKVPFDDSQFQAGDRLPGIIKSEIQGDRGQISAGWTYADGMWTLEFGRDLDTGSEYDVQFDELGDTYFFAVATFDNAQVRHGFQTGATDFTFQQE